MPKTFKEAFHVTKAPGYRYLWIDALCIIQDDFDDVQREMAQMGQIYRNSVLTISAASGSDTSSGLFIERDPRRYKPCNVTLTMMEGEERLQGIVSIHVFENEYENLLSKRGWVLQEEILSTRSLTFGPYGIKWRCMAESCNEARPQEYREDDVQKPIRYEQVTSLDNMRWLVRSADIFLKLEKPSSRRHNHFDAWYELVEAYSKRELTFMSDKLPAIAGLASLMAKSFSCTYGGGLWKEDLQIGLVWYVVGCEGISNAYYGSVERSSDHEYIAPSWSWASMTNRQISFCRYEENSRCQPEEGVQILDWNFSYPDGSLAPFGQVKSGILTVKGQLRKAFLVPCLDSWYSEAQTKHFGSLWRGHAVDPHQGFIFGDVALDSLEAHQNLFGRYRDQDDDFSNYHSWRESCELKTGTKPTLWFMSKAQPIWCLLCLVIVKWGKRQVVGLVLTPHDIKKQQYRRIGLIFINKESVFPWTETWGPSSWRRTNGRSYKEDRDEAHKLVHIV